jgi:hypothetical protein
MSDKSDKYGKRNRFLNLLREKKKNVTEDEFLKCLIKLKYERMVKMKLIPKMFDGEGFKCEAYEAVTKL